MRNSFHVIESLPAYALGSLEGDEARHAEEHLTGCHVCRAELGTWQRVADQLSLAAPDALPPAGMKSRLMSRVQPVHPMRSALPAGRVSGRLLRIGALTGAILIAVLAVSNILLWQKVNARDSLTGPLGMRAIALQNSNAASQASGFVVVSADGNNGVLVVDALPPLGADLEYQAWLVREGLSSSGGVFSVDENGYRGMRIEAPENLLTYSSVRVTIEPAGGSLEPTGGEVLSGSLFNP